MQRLIPALAEAEIVVGAYLAIRFSGGAAPRCCRRRRQRGRHASTCRSLPRGITLCNVFGHEPAIAEYVLMTMLRVDATGSSTR